MGKYKLILHILFLAFLGNSIAQEDLLDLEFKDLDGKIKSLRSRLDLNTNYVFMSTAFRLQICADKIDRIQYHKNYWKDRFNAEVILINDVHFNDVDFVIELMKTEEWDMKVLLSDQNLNSVGAPVDPTFFFKMTFQNTTQKFNIDIEKFLLENVDQIFFVPMLINDFHQIVLSDNCQRVELFNFEKSKTVQVGSEIYKDYEDYLFREEGLNGDVIRFNLQEQVEEIYIKHSTPLCRRQILKDVEGDELIYKIVDRYHVGSVMHSVTDKFIIADCHEESTPFEFVQGIGTNAGFFFDIEEGEIVSSLVCQQSEGQLTYQNDEISSFCITTDTENISDRIEISVYPNPTLETLNISIPGNGNKIIECYASDGKNIYSLETENNFESISLPKTESNIILVSILVEGERFVHRVVLLDQY